MKKKLLTGIFFLLLVICLSACFVNTRGPLPYGKWESSDPHIVMDINPQVYESPGVFYGVYYEDSIEIAVFIPFSGFSKQFDIYKLSDKINMSQPSFYRLALFGGSYTFTKNRLKYKLQPYWQEQSGITHTIVFNKIEEYEAPHPQDDTH